MNLCSWAKLPQGDATQSNSEKGGPGVKKKVGFKPGSLRHGAGLQSSGNSTRSFRSKKKKEKKKPNERQKRQDDLCNLDEWENLLISSSFWSASAQLE